MLHIWKMLSFTNPSYKYQQLLLNLPAFQVDYLVLSLGHSLLHLPQNMVHHVEQRKFS